MTTAPTDLASATTLVDRLRQQRQAGLIETHISWVLLDGQDAWKLKKPLHLPFLDASTLARRHQLCEEELRLNRRMAPSLYLDVTPITGTPDAPVLGGTGPAIEYAVHMRQFPEGALLGELLEAGQVQPVGPSQGVSVCPCEVGRARQDDQCERRSAEAVRSDHRAHGRNRK